MLIKNVYLADFWPIVNQFVSDRFRKISLELKKYISKYTFHLFLKEMLSNENRFPKIGNSFPIIGNGIPAASHEMPLIPGPDPHVAGSKAHARCGASFPLCQPPPSC